MEDKGTRETIVELLGRLIDNLKFFIRAEIDVYRAQMMERMRLAQSAIVMLVAALLLGQAVVVTLLVALVLILREWIGIYWASGVVVVSALIVTLLLAKAAGAKLKAMTRVSEVEE